MVQRKPIVFLVEDHELIGVGVRSLFEDEWEVYGPHSDGATVPLVVEVLKPALVILDLGLPNRNGMYLIEEIRAKSPASRIVIHTMYADYDLLMEARQRGAHGYVGKDAGVEELKKAVKAVAQGRTYFSPLIVPPRVRKGPVDPLHNAIRRLSQRRRRILKLIGDGLSTEEIAASLGVTERTIYWHRGVIRQGLGLESEEDLARAALLWNQTGDSITDSMDSPDGDRMHHSETDHSDERES